jgi:hypothetical protein
MPADFAFLLGLFLGVPIGHAATLFVLREMAKGAPETGPHQVNTNPMGRGLPTVPEPKLPGPFEL